jgi:hypothetical protein
MAAGTMKALPAASRAHSICATGRLAQLAGISIACYTRLEQGRSPNASDVALDAIADLLRLDATGRSHLHNLLRRPVNRVRPL